MWYKMTKYEYKILYYHRSEETEAELNKLASKGWRLVSQTTYSGTISNLILEREVGAYKVEY